MKRMPIRMIVAITFALISALAIAQTPQGQQQTAPAPTGTQPAQPQTAPAATAPAQTAPAVGQPAQTPPPVTIQPAPPPPEPGPGPAAAQPTAPPAEPAKNSLSAPSLQAAPAPQGCKTTDDNNRTRLRESCGYLVDANGKPAPNVSLQLVQSGQQNAYLFIFSQTITDVNGRFDFGPVPSGHYLLRTQPDAPVTVYNFVSTDIQNANGQCKKPVEVKAAAPGSCNSEVHSGKGSFPVIGNIFHKKGESKGGSKDAQPKQ